MLLGCGPQKMFPSGLAEIPDEVSHVRSGRGVLLETLDGAKVKGQNLIVAAGQRSFRIAVRRSMEKLDEALVDVYRVGSCRITFDAKPDQEYEIYTKIFSEERTRLVGIRKREDGKETVIGLTVHLRNLTTGRDQRLGENACELRLDCSRMNRFNVRPGSECTF